MIRDSGGTNKNTIRLRFQGIVRGVSRILSGPHIEVMDVYVSCLFYYKRIEVQIYNGFHAIRFRQHNSASAGARTIQYALHSPAPRTSLGLPCWHLCSLARCTLCNNVVVMQATPISRIFCFRFWESLSPSCIIYCRHRQPQGDNVANRRRDKRGELGN